jgi:hypothetical protein
MRINNTELYVILLLALTLLVWFFLWFFGRREQEGLSSSTHSGNGRKGQVGDAEKATRKTAP